MDRVSCDRQRSCVRPCCAALTMPLAGMAMRGSAPEQNGELEALCTPMAADPDLLDHVLERYLLDLIGKGALTGDRAGSVGGPAPPTAGDHAGHGNIASNCGRYRKEGTSDRLLFTACCLGVGWGGVGTGIGSAIAREGAGRTGSRSGEGSDRPKSSHSWLRTRYRTRGRGGGIRDSYPPGRGDNLVSSAIVTYCVCSYGNRQNA